MKKSDKSVLLKILGVIYFTGGIWKSEYAIAGAIFWLAAVLVEKDEI